ncbi:MAG: hypothetical protein HY560_12930 [Gemmatimonadetes bacterium]|nr:hypothetical protein [Gemmatimonadota bacterium]
MTRLGNVVLFALGIYLSIRAIAACYRVIDLWYAIRTAYPRVLRGLLGWGGTIVGTAALLGHHQRSVFLSGLLAFLVFYLSLFILRYLVLRRPA